MAQVEVEGGYVHYEEHGGDADPVLSCQWGFAPDAEYPMMLGEERFGAHRVVTVVARGYPPSSEIGEAPAGGWYPVWAADVAAVAEHLGISRFVYTGVSHGAGIGWHLCLSRPDLVDAFISVVGVPHDRSKRRDFRGGAGSAPNAALLQGGIVDTADPRRLARREATMRRALEGGPLVHRDAGFPLPECTTNEALMARLAETEVPTLLLCGGQDGIIPLEQSARAAAVVRGAKTVIFQDHGHSLARESPEAVCAEVELFLRELAELRVALADPAR